jgi:hypothetical protein
MPLDNRSKFNVALQIAAQGFGTTCVLPPRP